MEAGKNISLKLQYELLYLSNYPEWVIGSEKASDLVTIIIISNTSC